MQPWGERAAGRTQSPEHSSPGPPQPGPGPSPAAPEAEQVMLGVGDSFLEVVEIPAVFEAVSAKLLLLWAKAGLGSSLWLRAGGCKAALTLSLGGPKEAGCRASIPSGGGSLFAIHGDCEAYDTRTDRWHMVASMSTRRARVGVAAIGNRLYAVGGYDGTSDLATVESYDPVTNAQAAPECFGDGITCSAERYDPLTGTWTSIAAMSTRRRYVRVATLDGNLYAVGGYDSSSHLATVEKYEPQVNTWTPIATMLSRRSSAGVAVLEGALYVAGGNDGTSCLNSVERYSPKANAWESVAPMNIRRYIPGLSGPFLSPVSHPWPTGGSRGCPASHLVAMGLVRGRRELQPELYQKSTRTKSGWGPCMFTPGGSWGAKRLNFPAPPPTPRCLTSP
ncbi:kelch-like protein 17 [Sarcophilus harrisii]|uniref:kelch-like protein 17 n=1 Tax=Sarcophilus harrisii TaxID=9305 RepID=UPI001301C0ED|nr:kelch-like protein 17 [Sarcophilus harrisii]